MTPHMLLVLRRDVLPAIGSILLVTLGLVAPPVQLPAQQQSTAILVGQLVDRHTGTAIVGATVVIVGWSLEAGSDSAGRFTYAGLHPGSYMLQARAVGYTVANWVVRVSEAEEQHRTFPMEPIVVELNPVIVEGQPGFAEERRLGFERRRRSGLGYFITEDELHRSRATSISELLRVVPGVRATCNPAGCVLRMSRSPRNCSPEYFVDGFPATASTNANLPTMGIIGIEVYRSLSETPQQFIRSDQTCGAIVIWTRSGPS